MAGKLNPIHLIDGTVDLEFVATLNDAIDAWEENKRRAEEAAERQR